MNKIIALIIIGFMAFPAFSHDGGGEKPKPILTNYQDVLSQVKYPTVCRSRGIEGIVRVKLTIDRNGNLKKYKVLESPCSDLKAAVEDALPQLKFQPAYQDGEAVTSKIIVPVDFKLTL